MYDVPDDSVDNIFIVLRLWRLIILRQSQLVEDVTSVDIDIGALAETRSNGYTVLVFSIQSSIVFRV